MTAKTKTRTRQDDRSTRAPRTAKQVTPPTQQVKRTEDALPARESDAPLYLQVASILRTAIVRGIYPVGSRIPTEDELCRRYDVSRHTVRDALRRLRADGLITSRSGGRPVVVPPSAVGAVRLWSAEINREFFEHTMGMRLAVHSLEMVRINRVLAAHFSVPQGEDWLRVTGYRHSSEHGPATAWYDYLINAEYAAIGRLLPRHVGPIMLLIEDFFSEKLVHIQYSMSAVPMPAEHAATFNVAADSPSLMIATRCQNADEKLALVSLSVHPGGDIAYSIKLHDQEAARK